MKKERKITKERIVNALDLPKEIALNLAKMVILGEKELTIENYKGILEYTDTIIRIRTSGRVVKVLGRGLEIKVITDEDIQVSGHIKAIEFI